VILFVKVMNVPLLVRGFGLLLAIAFFLSASTWAREPWPKDALGYILPGLMLLMCGLICVPFARVRNRVVFWTLFGVFGAVFLVFVAIQGWLAVHQFGTAAFRLGLITVIPVTLLLVAQFPCIIYTWFHRQHEP